MPVSARVEMIYRVVDPQTKCETDDERVIAVKEGPLHGVSIVTSQMASRVLEGASGLGEADAQETVNFAASNGGKGSDVGLRDRSEEIKDVSPMHFGSRL